MQITQNGYKDGTINNRNDLVAVLIERGYSVENKGDKIAISLPNSDQIVSLSGELFTKTLKNAHINAVEPQKADLGINIPPKAQNANMSVSVRSDSHLNNQPPIPENIQAENVPVRVHNSWDIFRDF